MTLKTRLTLALLLLSIVPLVSLGFLSTFIARQSLEETASNQLMSVRDIKKDFLGNYFSTALSQVKTFSENGMVVDAMKLLPGYFESIAVENDFAREQVEQARIRLKDYYQEAFGKRYAEKNDGKQPNLGAMLRLPDSTAVAQDLYISQNPHPLGSKELLDAAKDRSRYSELHARIHPVIRSYLNEFGYYDIFLVDTRGVIVYSVFKELDYATSLMDGPYRDTNFAETFREALAAGQKGAFESVFHSDFERYPPSYEDPASFSASPVEFNGACIGVVLMQMPIDGINSIMSERSGMGKSGETYLVGGDFLMRSDSFLDSKNRTVRASFANPAAGSVDTPAVRKALNGETGVSMIHDYNGNPVVSAFAPFAIAGTTWAILAEIDVAEAFVSVRKLQWWNGGIAVLAIVLVFGASLYLVQSILAKIGGEPDAVNSLMTRLAKGDLTAEMSVRHGDRVSILYHLLEMTKGLRSGFGDIQNGVRDLASSTTELSSIATQLAGNASTTQSLTSSVASAAEQTSANVASVAAATEQMSTNIRALASASEQMTSTIDEIARGTDNGQQIARRAVDSVKGASGRMQQLGEMMRKIDSITDTIKAISQQTNLLALNATIEAASAGEAGKGFAVVAHEIKELSRQTAQATEQIQGSLAGIQESTAQSIGDVSQVAGIIEEIFEITATIAASIQEQSATTAEIANNVSQTADGLQEIARRIAEVETVSHGLADDVGKVHHSADEIAAASQQLNCSATELSEFAEKVNAIASHYQVGVRS
jgi:methyl-accepting chemotaxis protein